MQIPTHNYLSAVYSCIQTDAAKPQNIVKRIVYLANKLFVFMKRIVYYVRYRHWINNLKGRKVLKQYIWDATSTNKNIASDKTAQKIFDKLLHSSRGSGTYADGIERAWISEKFEAKEDKTYFRVKKLLPTDNKMLFHIHGDEFGANNEALEGHQSHLTFNYLKNYLANRKEQDLDLYGFSDDILEKLDNAASLYRSQDFITQASVQIKQSVKAKKNVLLLGGWSGAPSGHAMCYEIIPESDATVTFRLYNLGAGSNYHFSGIVGNKVKALPYCDFTGVSEAISTNSYTR